MTAAPPPELARLYAAAEQLLARLAAEAAPLATGALPSPSGYRPETLTPLPLMAELAACRDLAAPSTLETVDALLAAAPHLHWRRDYSRADGFSEADLARYGWCQPAGPSGAFVSDAHRLMLGYWGPGFYYPRHWHAPAEVYVVLAGSAVFFADGREDRLCRAGETVWHAPRQIHGAEMVPGPLLAMGLWWGDDLLAKSTLVDRPGQRERRP